jgi:hypothetical protein
MVRAGIPNQVSELNQPTALIGGFGSPAASG